MNTSTAIVTCPNPGCKAPNPLDRNFCQKCKTYIPKRYLWTLDRTVNNFGKGELLGDRYIVVSQNTVLDLHPGLTPVTTEDISPEILPYLKLSAYQPQIPKVYGLVANSSSQSEAIWLLEDAPIYAQGVPASWVGRLMPKLVEAWQDQNITTLRQINWLTQIVELWQPMVMEKVASTLLNPESLRVEGSLVRILELVPDRQGAPTLSDLGRFWQKCLPQIDPSAADFWQVLGQQLASGQFTSPEQLLDVLGKALNSCASSYNHLYQIATYSDQGPTRSRNEDACYPSSASFLNSITGKDLGLTIVCDGIGGHEGGNVASNMAIEIIHQDIVQSLTQPTKWESKSVSDQLESFIRHANDQISQRNDSEQRHSRQRMGTTVVMAVNHGHEVYLAHVGDSRAYRISQTGCHQVTLDDDLAAREVRLGYALYREALQHSSSGSLIQALGMGGSYNLHPTVQKFVIDEDCIFLLCSDGLSDRDRVEQYWESLVLPVLEGKKDLGKLSQELLHIGNHLNGHDNVTLGLLYCRAQMSREAGRSSIPLPPPVVPLPTPVRGDNQPTRLQIQEESTTIQREPGVPYASLSRVAAPKSNRWRWGFLIPLGLVLVGAIGTGVAYHFGLLSPFSNPVSSSPSPSSDTKQNTNIQEGQFYETDREILSVPEPSQKISKNELIKVLKVGKDGSEEIKVQICSSQQDSISNSSQPRSNHNNQRSEVTIKTSDLNSDSAKLRSIKSLSDLQDKGECTRVGGKVKT
jgi:serine/threonine protein phosphatase PrpC